MKAAVLEKLDSPLMIRDVELTPLQIGQVKVKILVSGICGAQLQEISGNKGNAKFLPHLMGHEGCGIVEEIGPGVTRVKPGDKVVAHWRVGAGIESTFPQYILDGKTISSGKITTFNEYSIISENRLTAVPFDTDPVLGALLGCSITTALGIINNDANIHIGETVMIVGSGGVGLNLIKGAVLAGASEVIAVDKFDTKKLCCLSCGATSFYNIDSSDLTSIKADAIIDTTGNVDAISKTLPLLADKGRYILVAHPKPGTILPIENINGLFGSNGKTIIATQGGSTNPNQDIPRYIKLYNCGRFDISNIVTHTYTLDEINEAITTLRSGTAGRIMIKM